MLVFDSAVVHGSAARLQHSIHKLHKAKHEVDVAWSQAEKSSCLKASQSVSMYCHEIALVYCALCSVVVSNWISVAEGRAQSSTLYVGVQLCVSQLKLQSSQVLLADVGTI